MRKTSALLTLGAVLAVSGCARFDDAPSEASRPSSVERDLEHWLRLLASSDPDLRAVGYYGLLEIGPAATPGVCEVLRAGVPEARQTAATLLGQTGARDPRAVRSLAGALRDPHESVRLAAAGALAHIGPAAQTAVPVLRNLREDPNPEVAQAAGEALRCIGPGKAVR